jgi:hypothetical protein
MVRRRSGLTFCALSHRTGGIEILEFERRRRYSCLLSRGTVCLETDAMSMVPNAEANRLLAALPDPEFQMLLPDLQPV